MKELYTNAKIELVEFDVIEIITTSDVAGGFGGEDDVLTPGV